MASIRASRKSPTCLIVLAAIFAINGTSGTSRHATSATSTDHEIGRSFDEASPNALIFGDDESSSRSDWKVAHRLVGGHMRFETSTASPLTRNGKEAERKELGTESDEATWDDGLVVSSAGNGKEKSVARSDDDDDAEKTLSQQIKEGKYGLIQNELYPTKPKRPGILSYSANPDVPKDNAKNLGGLDEDEIWLAENHVLVLRGGNFPDHSKNVNYASSANDWSPIDDYKAPKRQVKIPPNPKIPPPFPVQLTENGPVRVIGVNGSSSAGESSDEQDFSRDRGFLPGQGPFFAITRNGTFHAQDLTSQENTMKKTLGENEERSGKSGHVPARDAGVIGPFYSSLPPGAVFVMPPGNQTDYDEDDQSIYYPPPYSFTYKQDNSTPVPPGPLVPGIILPPPPDFFSSLDEKRVSLKNRPTKYPKRPATTIAPRVAPTYYPARKSSPKPFKVTSVAGGSPSKPTSAKYASRGASFTMKPVSDIKYKTTTTTTRSTDKSGRERAKSTIRVPEATTTPVERPTSLEITEFPTTLPNVRAKTTSRSRWVPSVSSNPVPLVAYHSSSTPSVVHQPVEVTPASVNVITEGKQRGSTHQASYYFYEEANDEIVTTSSPPVYYGTTTETPYYSLRDLADESKPRDAESYYQPRIVPTQRVPKHFRLDSSKPVPETNLRYRPNHFAPNSVASSEGQRELSESPYYEDVTERPRLRSYYTTAKPPSFIAENDYEPATEAKPIYEYSYESADYSKRREPDYPGVRAENQRPSYYGETRDDRTPEAFDEWREEAREERPRYDYEEGETLPEQDIQPERENDDRYRNRLSYRTTTARPAIVATANPREVYYTRQDDQLLDDATREYFTNFGKKLGGESPRSTTPIYANGRPVTERTDFGEVRSYVTSNEYEGAEEQRPVYQPLGVSVRYGDQARRPYSLENDVGVNYKDPLPPNNPQSEWIPGFEPSQPPDAAPLVAHRQHHTEVDGRDYDRRFAPVGNYDLRDPSEGTGRFDGRAPTNFVPLDNSRDDDRASHRTARPLSLQDDIAVNYRDPRPSLNPDAEYVEPALLRNNNPDKASYFAYRLPGDGGHFYFLTPRAISQRQDEYGGYLYSRPRGVRFSRQRRRGPRDS